MSHESDHIVGPGRENPLFTLSYPQARATLKINKLVKKAYKQTKGKLKESIPPGTDPCRAPSLTTCQGK